MGETLSMSASELERNFVIRQIAAGQFSQAIGAERLGIGLRQMKRLIRLWRAEGDAGLVSRQRGRPSNRTLPREFHTSLETHLRGQYQGFGPTLAAEKLLERDGVKVSAETVRRARIRLKLWHPKKRKVKRVYQLCERRSGFGELIQIDGSPHAWLEERGPRCTLIVFIDDATTRLTALRFVPVESTQAYLETLRDQVLDHGHPLAFYSDRHSIFSGECQGCPARRRQDRIRPGLGPPGDSVDPRSDPAGERTRGTGELNVAGSAGKGDASSEYLHNLVSHLDFTNIYGFLERKIRGESPR